MEYPGKKFHLECVSSTNGRGQHLAEQDAARMLGMEIADVFEWERSCERDKQVSKMTVYVLTEAQLQSMFNSDETPQNNGYLPKSIER